MDLEASDVHLRLQCSVIDLNHVDYLARFERFETDLRVILTRLNIVANEIPTANASQNRRGYREYYDENLADKVAELYQKDIQVFGYEF